jgi:hypothetical protein
LEVGSSNHQSSNYGRIHDCRIFITHTVVNQPIIIWRIRKTSKDEHNGIYCFCSFLLHLQQKRRNITNGGRAGGKPHHCSHESRLVSVDACFEPKRLGRMSVREYHSQLNQNKYKRKKRYLIGLQCKQTTNRTTLHIHYYHHLKTNIRTHTQAHAQNTLK